MRKEVILMELKSLYCPNCGAAVKLVDGLDTFYCQYCGYQIHLEGMSDEAYKARTKVKQMEHEERMQDKKDAYGRFEGEMEDKSDKRMWIFWAVGMGLLIFAMIALFYLGTTL